MDEWADQKSTSWRKKQRTNAGSGSDTANQARIVCPKARFALATLRSFASPSPRRQERSWGLQRVGGRPSTGAIWGTRTGLARRAAGPADMTQAVVVAQPRDNSAIRRSRNRPPFRCAPAREPAGPRIAATLSASRQHRVPRSRWPRCHRGRGPPDPVRSHRRPRL